MLIKAADDKTKAIEALKVLAACPDVSPDTRQKIEQEIRNIQSGIKGEADINPFCSNFPSPIGCASFFR